MILQKKYMVHPAGLEPATNGFEDRYSSNWAMSAYGAIDRARTCDLTLRRGALFQLSYYCIKIHKTLKYPSKLSSSPFSA